MQWPECRTQVHYIVISTHKPNPKAVDDDDAPFVPAADLLLAVVVVGAKHAPPPFRRVKLLPILRLSPLPTTRDNAPPTGSLNWQKVLGFNKIWIHAT